MVTSSHICQHGLQFWALGVLPAGLVSEDTVQGHPVQLTCIVLVYAAHPNIANALALRVWGGGAGGYALFSDVSG
jgi:hypothetical protein